MTTSRISVVSFTDRQLLPRPHNTQLGQVSQQMLSNAVINTSIFIVWTISHEILLNKIKNRIDNNWFRSDISTRMQSVKIRNDISYKKSISFGVPQFSISYMILFKYSLTTYQQLQTTTSLFKIPVTQFLQDAPVSNSSKIIRNNH